MKPAFKTTALAILVALGVTACGGGSKGGNAQEVAPTPVNPQTPAPTVENPQTPAPTVENPQTPEQPSVGYQYNDNLKNKQGKEWRLVDSSLNNALFGQVVDGVYGSGFNLDTIYINFNQLSDNKLGEFSGTLKGDFLLSTSVPSDTLNYTFVNQPYSTYGFVTDAHGESHTFYLIQQAEQKSSESEANNEFLNSIAGLSHLATKYDYKVDPKGSATYKGGVFAKVDYADERYSSNSNKGSLVKADGSFTVTANFDNATVSGTLNSDTVGEIKLVQANLDDRYKVNFGGNHAYMGSESGSYYVSLGGKDLNDVVGDVRFNYILGEKTIKIDGVDKVLTKYNASFGGTKQ